jgi:hypothetical protein
VLHGDFHLCYTSDMPWLCVRWCSSHGPPSSMLYVASSFFHVFSLLSINSFNLYLPPPHVLPPSHTFLVMKALASLLASSPIRQISRSFLAASCGPLGPTSVAHYWLFFSAVLAVVDLWGRRYRWNSSSVAKSGSSGLSSAKVL